MRHGLQRIFFFTMAPVLGLACGRNPRFCDPDNGISCGNPDWVCDVQGVCPASDNLTNSCIAPGDICWDAGQSTGFHVGGTAVGVRATTTLQLDWESGYEDLDVTEDGAFSFAHIFRAGESYTVGFNGSPPCVIMNGSGSISDADIQDVVATCEGVTELASIVLSIPGQLAPSFSPTTLSYGAATSFVAQQTTVTASLAYADASMTINGQNAVSGIASQPIALSAGSNIIEVGISHPAGFPRTYTLDVNRGATAVVAATYAKASNTGASDKFGFAVAASGDTVVVGAPGESSSGLQSDNSVTSAGAVYVLRLGVQGWAQEAYLKAATVGASDEFGSSVAIDGDVIIVGVPREDSAATGINGDAADDSMTDAGAVYVFRRSGSVWTQEAYVKPGISDAGDRFGHSVAISGDTFVVGAPYEDSPRFSPASNTASNSGAAYVFVRDSNSWAQQELLKPTDDETARNFGWHVAIDGDVAVVGAPFEHSNATGVNGNATDNSLTGAGAAYVFRRLGTWSQEAYLKASNTRGLATFGWNVGVSGNVVAVSSPAESSAATGINGNQSDTSAPGAGAAYVFRKTGPAWAQEAYVKASNTEAYDNFGWALAFHGDVLVVGAPSEASSAIGVGGNQSNNFSTDSGAAYVFLRGTALWTQETYAKATNTGDADKFGEVIALSRDTVVVGASNEDGSGTGLDSNGSDNSAFEAGAAYLFR